MALRQTRNDCSAYAFAFAGHYTFVLSRDKWLPLLAIVRHLDATHKGEMDRRPCTTQILELDISKSLPQSPGKTRPSIISILHSSKTDLSFSCV